MWLNSEICCMNVPELKVSAFTLRKQRVVEFWRFNWFVIYYKLQQFPTCGRWWLALPVCTQMQFPGRTAAGVPCCGKPARLCCVDRLWLLKSVAIQEERGVWAHPPLPHLPSFFLIQLWGATPLSQLPVLLLIGPSWPYLHLSAQAHLSCLCWSFISVFLSFFFFLTLLSTFSCSKMYIRKEWLTFESYCFKAFCVAVA